MLSTLRHLLPDSTAWRLVVERTLKKYLRGVATVGDDVVSFVDDVYDDLWPDLTRELPEWLDQFGIEYWPWSNDDDMRAYLDFRWGEDRGQSPKALQDKLQAAGFDAYVYDSFDMADVSLSTYTGDSRLITEDADPQGFCFAQGGRKLYLAGAGGSAIYQHTLSTPYSLASATYDSASFATTTQDESTLDVKLSDDGTKMFVLGAEFGAVYEYDLPTPYVVTGATYVDSMSVSAKDTVPTSFHWKPDGKEVYVIGTSSDDVHQYTLTAAWDVSTGSFTRTYDPSLTDPVGIAFDQHGEFMYLLSPNVSGTIQQYSLATAWDISSASSDSLSLDPTTIDATPRNIVLEGSRLFFLGVTADALFRLRLGAWRDPLDYAAQPLRGNTQCGDDGSGINPVAECGEEPDDQTSLDSATCNQFLANDVFYLVNNTLTQDAPPPIPTDSGKWGPFWYVGGTPIGTEMELDAYDRQRFEKLCLKQGPAEQYIVTIVERWTTTALGVWVYESAGDTLDSGEWQFTVTTTTHMKVTSTDNDGTAWLVELTAVSVGDSLRWEKTDGSGEWIEYEVTGAPSTVGGPPQHVTYAINTTPKGSSSNWGGLLGEMRLYHREST